MGECTSGALGGTGFLYGSDAPQTLTYAFGKSVTDTVHLCPRTVRYQEVSSETDIAPSADDVEIVFSQTIHVSEMIGFMIAPNRDCTIKTNSASSPDDTLTLKAGKPYVWHLRGYHTNPFTTDFDRVYVTNDSEARALNITFNFVEDE